MEVRQGRQMIESLIAGGERINVEFKGEGRSQLSDNDIVEAVVCLAHLPANVDSGTLLIGVEDDGAITGARPRHGQHTDPYRLQAVIANKIEPSIHVDVTVITFSGKDVISIRVPHQGIIHATRQGRTLRRMMTIDGPQCVPFYPHEYHSYLSDLGQGGTSARLFPDLDFTAFDPLEIERVRRTITRLRGDRLLTTLDDIELVKALGLVEIRSPHTRPRAPAASNS